MSMNVLRPLNGESKKERLKKEREERLLTIEKTAADELNNYVKALQDKYNITVVPSVVLGVNAIRGIEPITHKIDVVSNERFNRNV